MKNAGKQEADQKMYKITSRLSALPAVNMIA